MSNRNNLSPTVWGPKTWFFLETAAIGYPENPSDAEKLAASNLLYSLEHLLPCYGCRVHYSDFLYNYKKEIPMDIIVENRHSFMKFIVDVHNNVLERTNKPTRTLEEVFAYYKKALSAKPKTIEDKIEYFKNTKEDFKNTVEDYNFLVYILIGFVIGLIIYKLYLSYNNK